MIFHPFFMLLPCFSNAYGIVDARYCNLPTWGGQHRYPHSVLGIVAYFRWNYKFFDRMHGRAGQNRRNDGFTARID